MKNKISVSMCSALLIGSLVGSLGTADVAAFASSKDLKIKVAQQVGLFKDVPTNHYAFDAIEWGKNKGLINGYTDPEGKPNGLFGPDDDVTEAQFVKMVATYFGLKDDAGDLSKKGLSKGQLHWADSHYDALAKYGAPLHGYFDNTVRDQTINRGTVAQVLGYLMGDTSSLEGSIHYLLDNGITKGQNPQFEGQDLNLFFGSTNNLSRSQIIVFLHRIETNGLNKFGQGSSAYAEVKNDLNSKANSAVVDRNGYDEKSNTTDSVSNGFTLINSSTSKLDDLPKDENGNVIVSVDMNGSSSIQQTKAVKLENSLTPILKSVLRDGEDYKTNFEDESIEAVYVHTNETQRSLYSVLSYSPEAAKESAYNSASEYVLDKIYSMDIERYEADLDFHVNNLIAFGLVKEGTDKNKLKKFILDSSKETKWGDGIVSKELGLHGIVILNQFIEIGKIMK